MGHEHRPDVIRGAVEAGLESFEQSWDGRGAGCPGERRAQLVEHVRRSVQACITGRVASMAIALRVGSQMVSSEEACLASMEVLLEHLAQSLWPLTQAMGDDFETVLARESVEYVVNVLRDRACERRSAG